MMGLTAVQQNCIDFLKSYQEEHGIMPSYREVADHLGIKSLSRIHQLVVSLEDRGVIRRIAAKARAMEIVEPSSLRAVLLSSETFGLVKLFAGSNRTTVDDAVNAIIRERLGVSA